MGDVEGMDAQRHPGRRDSDEPCDPTHPDYIGPTPGAVEAIDRLRHHLVRRVTLLAVLMALIGVWTVVLQLRASDESGKTHRLVVETAQLARQTAALARQNAHLTAQIQQQRYDVAFNNCNDQNTRHDETKVRLKRGFAAARQSPQTRAEAAQQYAFTVSLIDALAPKRQSCQDYAHSVVTIHSHVKSTRPGG